MIRVYTLTRGPMLPGLSGSLNAYACARGLGNKVALSNARDVVDHVTLSGTLVAYTDGLFGVDSGRTTIEVVDAANGLIMRTVPDAGAYTNGCWFHFRAVVDLVVTRRGSVAWTDREATDRNGTCKTTAFAVYRAEILRPELLDKGLTIDAKSLRLSGHTVSWTKAGQKHSAHLL